MRIVSVVDRPRWGLFNHALALRQANEEYWGRRDEILCHSSLLSADPSCSLFSPWAMLRKSSRGDHIIIWGLGTAFLLAPLLRLLGRKTVYIYHEPATVFERISKSHNVFRSVATALMLRIYLSMFSKVLVPNENNARSLGLPFLRLPTRPTPLLPSPARGPSEPLHLVFLGAQLAARSLELFSALEAFGPTGGGGKVRFSFFPGAMGSTEAEKATLLAQGRSVVWNVWNVPYNQSAVTLDAVKYGVPMLASDFEPLMEELCQAGAFLGRDRLDLRNALSAIEQIDLKYDEMAAKAAWIAWKWFNPEILAKEWATVLED